MWFRFRKLSFILFRLIFSFVCCTFCVFRSPDASVELCISSKCVKICQSCVLKMNILKCGESFTNQMCFFYEDRGIMTVKMRSDQTQYCRKIASIVNKQIILFNIIYNKLFDKWQVNLLQNDYRG